SCPICAQSLEGLRNDSLSIHLLVHCMQGRMWCCCGVAEEDATRYGVGPSVSTFNFLGIERVGGCMKVFFCKSALEKHL
ncbi:hypothetical protein DFH06DRAFT_908592, partial [Mycena polygramma]